MPRLLLTLLILAAFMTGCASTRNQPVEEVLLKQDEIQKALSKTKPPYNFRYSVYPVGNGIAMQATPRLHPRHMASLDFEEGDVPVVEVQGKAKRMKMNLLFDTSSEASWIEFDRAMEFGAIFLGLDGNTIPYRGQTYIGQASAYAAVVTQLRFDQCFIEDAAMYVRMARHSLGPLARGIVEPHIDAVLGYDVMKHFEYIQFNLSEQQVVLSATIPYTPNANRLTGEASIVKNSAGLGLVVEGSMGSEETPIILDFAGNYSFARSDANVNHTQLVSLGEVVYVDVPTAPSIAPDGLPRAGRMMLEKYVVTICPRAGVVYFERPVK